jgi:4-hydroxybenzoate polyprenyltransferase
MSPFAQSSSAPVHAAAPRAIWGRFNLLARDIKIGHTIFAMPWAILATVMAGRDEPLRLLAGKLALIVAAMVAARTVAMTSNRLLDAAIDAENPRTAARAIPAGRLSRGFVLSVLIGCALAFIAVTASFDVLYRNPWPIVFAVPVLAWISAYPLLKRFTRLCHYYLGSSLALAPLCAWVAVRGDIRLPPVLIAAAVLLWTAGFDIIYACQDYASDVRQGLFSIPAKLGIARALWVSRLTHAACAGVLIAIAATSPGLGIFFAIGVAIAIGLLIVEQGLVRSDDLSRAGVAFFTINGVISLLLGTLGIIDLLR